MENTKDIIIEEAFKLFLTHSYEAVSISQLSNAIGMTKGALYHHFKNKEELFKMVVDKYLIIPTISADFESITLYEYIQIASNHAEGIIRSLIKNTNEFSFSPIDYISLFADAFRHYPSYDKISGEFINEEIEKITVVIENAIKSGEIREDINVSLIASNFFSINMGLAGNIVRDYPIEETIGMLKEQNLEFYKLLKK